MVFLRVSPIAIAKALGMGSTRRAELQVFGVGLFNKREKTSPIPLDRGALPRLREKRPAFVRFWQLSFGREMGLGACASRQAHKGRFVVVLRGDRPTCPGSRAWLVVRRSGGDGMRHDVICPDLVWCAVVATARKNSTAS